MSKNLCGLEKFTKSIIAITQSLYAQDTHDDEILITDRFLIHLIQKL